MAFLSGEAVSIEKNSDLDLGVVFNSLPEDIYEVYGKLYSDLEDYFQPFKLDLVFLQEADPLFQYEAIQGNLLYFDNESILDSYEEKIIKLASDLSFKKEAFQKEIFEAIKDGYFEITYR